MLTFLIVLQVLVSILLVLVVLLQPGNRGGVSAALGGAGGETVFGGRGANTFLSKLTLGCAVCFMVGSFALSFMSTTRDSILDKEFRNLPTGAVAPANEAAQGTEELLAPKIDVQSGKETKETK